MARKARKSRTAPRPEPIGRIDSWIGVIADPRPAVTNDQRRDAFNHIMEYHAAARKRTA